MHAGPSSRPKLTAHLAERVDGASLAVLRIAVGGAVAWDAAKLWWLDLVELYFQLPEHELKYPGFAWVPIPQGAWIHVLLATTVVGGLGLALGFKQRLSAAIATVAFSWLFLCEASRYLNHHYLMCLLAALFMFVPASGAWSLDARLQPRVHDGSAPRWALWTMRFQLGVVYAFAGIAKIDGDWLRGAPLDHWLLVSAGRSDAVRWMLRWESLPVLVAWSGLAFDLFVVPALLWRRTRAVALVVAMTFHLANAHLFHIGVFPWLMLAATTIFLDPSWPRRLLRRSPLAPEVRREPIRATTSALLIAWCAVQLLLPLRHHLYPGDVSWNEEGHRFAWRMKLRDKDTALSFRVTDRATGAVHDVGPRTVLTGYQSLNVDGRPDLIHQTALFIAEEERMAGRDVEVRAHAPTSLNSRRPELLIDPNVDLAAEPVRTWEPYPWLLPSTEPLPAR